MGAHETKRRINPYYYFLIVRLIELEAVGFNKPSMPLVYTYLRLTLKRKMPTLPKKKSKPPTLNSLVTNMRQNLFVDLPDLSFSEITLERFIMCLSELAYFSDWSSFEDYFKNDHAAVESNKFRTRAFSLIDPSIQYNIKVWANNRAREVYNQHYQKKGIPDGCLVFESDGKKIIRTATREELALLTSRNEWICSEIERIENKIELYDKNPTCFTVVTNSAHEVQGFLTVLPLNFSFYGKLMEKEGQKPHKRMITADDILSPDQDGFVILISLSNTYIWPFVNSIYRIIYHISKVRGAEVVLLIDNEANYHLSKSLNWGHKSRSNKQCPVGKVCYFWKHMDSESLGYIFDPPDENVQAAMSGLSF